MSLAMARPSSFADGLVDSRAVSAAQPPSGAAHVRPMTPVGDATDRSQNEPLAHTDALVGQAGYTGRPDRSRIRAIPVCKDLIREATCR